MNIPQWAMSLIFAVVWFIAIQESLVCISNILLSLKLPSKDLSELIGWQAGITAVAWAILIVYWFN